MRDADDADLGKAECALAVQAAILLPILSLDGFRVGSAGRSIGLKAESRSVPVCVSLGSNGFCGTGGGIGGGTASRSETNMVWFFRGGRAGGIVGTVGKGSSFTFGDLDFDRSAARPEPLALRSHCGGFGLTDGFGFASISIDERLLSKEVVEADIGGASEDKEGLARAGEVEFGDLDAGGSMESAPRLEADQHSNRHRLSSTYCWVWGTSGAFSLPFTPAGKPFPAFWLEDVSAHGPNEKPAAVFCGLSDKASKALGGAGLGRGDSRLATEEA